MRDDSQLLIAAAPCLVAPAVGSFHFLFQAQQKPVSQTSSYETIWGTNSAFKEPFDYGPIIHSILNYIAPIIKFVHIP